MVFEVINVTVVVKIVELDVSGRGFALVFDDGTSDVDIEKDRVSIY